MVNEDMTKQIGERIWKWQQALGRLGARYTGNGSHREYIRFIKNQLKEIGLSAFTDEYTFTRWEASKASLSIEGDPDGEDRLSVLSNYPYSEKTDGAGLCEEVVFCRTRRQLKKATGKIAVMEVRNTLLPTRLVFRTRRRAEGFPRFMRHPVVGSTIFGPDLSVAERYGVRGIICFWKDCTDELALGQYLPFTTPPHDCPAVWVTRESGVRLRELARKRGRVRLTLIAEVDEEATSETVYTIVPGKNDRESILINTHTDGPNACEENGGLALLALAEHFSRIPLEQRKRTLVFVFATGHFQIPQFGLDGNQATSRWLREHGELWDGKDGNKRAVAGVTLEHLGCREWTGTPSDASSFSDTKPDFELVYTSDRQMEKVYWNATEGRTKIRSVTLKPGKFYFGEGEPLHKVSIPTISLVPAPLYLCSEAPDGHIDKIDRELLLQQIETFTHVVQSLDTLSVD